MQASREGVPRQFSVLAPSFSRLSLGSRVGVTRQFSPVSDGCLTAALKSEALQHTKALTLNPTLPNSVHGFRGYVMPVALKMAP